MMRSPSARESSSGRMRARRQDGVGMVEVMLAALIVTVGLMTLLALFAQAITVTQTAQLDMIARQKAREALESIYTARNTEQVVFDQIANVDGGGIFLTDFQDLGTPGADGLVNTADDGPVEQMYLPGPDNRLGTEDDVVRLLDGFERRIEIAGAGGDLKEITITIRFRMPNGMERTVQIRSLISRFR